jgi:predicted O-methyltransferase YrrM
MKKNYSEIHGWCDKEITSLYDRAILEAKDGSVFVEIGCYLGKSTCYMIDEIKKSGKNIKFYVIDNFSSLGNVEQQFLENLGEKRLKSITFINEDSRTSARHFDSESVDFIFIDTDHISYQLIGELTAWDSKLKKGCLVSGHDFHHRDVSKTFEHFKTPLYNVIYSYIKGEDWIQSSWWYIK